jgi:hypothetical protein
LGDQERNQLLGEWPETETKESCSDHEIDGVWDESSDDKGKEAMFAEHQQVPTGWTTSANFSSVESGRWCKRPGLDGGANASGWFPDEKWYGRMSQPRQTGADIQDEWMVPFDELIKVPSYVAAPPGHEVPLPAAGTLPGGPVCIWNARPDGCGHVGGLAGHPQDEGKDIFTDGQQVFQPVASATGETLFTDGKQLYASVCVMFDPPSPALTPESQTQGFSFLSDSDYEDDECL